MSQPGRHLSLHLGAALGVAALVCMLPAAALSLLGARTTFLLLTLGLGIAAPLAFLLFFLFKVARWIRTPVAFRIPLTVGQQHGLAGIPHARTGSPRSVGETFVRTLLDALLFRPLSRATPSAPRIGRALAHGMDRFLWIVAALFHASLAIVVLRHLRLFLEPVPAVITFLDEVDRITEMVLPKLHASSILFLLALALLMGRRLVLRRVRYISLAADYFPLLLLLAIATTGLVMRHVLRTDVTAVKQWTVGMANGAFVVPLSGNAWLAMHVSLVALLVVYFPLSKLMHMPGVLLSPTLTMANTNRGQHHENPRNPKVETMHYADYEATFRERMLEAGLPVEKE